MKSIEEQLKKTIRDCHLENTLNVEDTKSAIWNENSTEAINELTRIFMNHSNNKTDLKTIIKIIQDCWNYFPHRSLGGKSPNEMISRSFGPSCKKTMAENNKKYQKTLFDIKLTLAGNSKNKTRIIPWNKNLYAFEYSLKHEEVMERFYELQEDKKLTETKYLKAIVKLVATDEYFFDGIIILSQVLGNNNQSDKALKILEDTVTRARHLLPKKFDPNTNQIPWGVVENRPYLRLLLERAMSYEAVVGERESIPFYEEILRLNPNDNQGVRAMLATLYLRTGRPTEVLKLASVYPNDVQAELAMGQILAHLMLSDKEEAEKSIKKNQKYLNHLIEELFSKSHQLPKNSQPGYITLGGKDEAYFYWLAQGNLWKKLPGAMEFLEKHRHKT